MIRAGMIRKVAAGISTYLPLGWRSLQKLSAIVRHEMTSAGAVELSMPAVQPAELWIESGRWQKYGKELLRFRDRHQRDFCFGPTHEEVITDLVRRDVKSYRQLPFNLFQIQTKFRDEIRPRFGLMRGREFLMKDAYSFHATPESLDEAYEAMRAAYRRIFEACRLDYTVVDADAGAIGGSSSHEFMVTAATGESAVVHCAACGYGANVEKAARGAWTVAAEVTDRAPTPLSRHDTPGKRSVLEVALFLGVPAAEFVKTLVYETDKGFVAVAIRGDREVNEVKLLNALNVEHLQLASEDKVLAATGAPVGSLGPVGLPASLPLLADLSVEALRSFTCGANETGVHLSGVHWGRDASAREFRDLVTVVDGDPCPQCGAVLTLSRGIEVGHIFKLGDKYSVAMKCEFTDEAGAQKPMIMGCYGLGIGRTVAAAIEQNHDADGIIWPLPLAPFEVLVLSLNPNDAETARTAERIAVELAGKGLDVLYDDRDERPGVKFKDADLIGIPLRVVVGGKSLAAGQIELSLRRDRQKLQVPVADALAKALELAAAARA